MPAELTPSVVEGEVVREYRVLDGVTSFAFVGATFEVAVGALRLGNAVRRAAWGEKRIVVAYVRREANSKTLATWAPRWDMETAPGQFVLNWQLTSGDILANDWQSANVR